MLSDSEAMKKFKKIQDSCQPSNPSWKINSKSPSFLKHSTSWISIKIRFQNLKVRNPRVFPKSSTCPTPLPKKHSHIQVGADHMHLKICFKSEISHLNCFFYNAELFSREASYKNKFKLRGIFGGKPINKKIPRLSNLNPPNPNPTWTPHY